MGEKGGANRPRYAGVATDGKPFVHHGVEENVEAHVEQPESHGFTPQAEKPDDDVDDNGKGQGGDNGQPQGEGEPHEQKGIGVCAEAQEHGLPQGQHARVPHLDVDGGREQGHDQDLGQKVCPGPRQQEGEADQGNDDQSSADESSISVCPLHLSALPREQTLWSHQEHDNHQHGRQKAVEPWEKHGPESVHQTDDQGG